MNTGNKIVWTPQRRLEWGKHQRECYTQEWRDKISASLKEGFESGRIQRRAHSPEVMQRIALKLSLQRKGKRIRKTPIREWEKKKAADLLRATRGPGNRNEKTWRLRSPENRVFVFKNLQHFLRENPNLFDPSDTLVIGKKSRATRGIQSLSPRLQKNSGSWKGWTWYSHLEESRNNGNDLLNRPESLGDCKNPNR